MVIEDSYGFYVRAKPNDCTLEQTVKYITRYLGRPVIAASRIDAYDGKNVTFHYNRHEDESHVVEKIPALDFIKRLIIHIPEKHFKMVRYYGIYAKHHKQHHGESLHSLFCHDFFISILVYTIFVNLRSFLIIKKTRPKPCFYLFLVFYFKSYISAIPTG